MENRMKQNNEINLHVNLSDIFCKAIIYTR